MKLIGNLFVFLMFVFFLSCNDSEKQVNQRGTSNEDSDIDSIKVVDVKFQSEGVYLSGTIFRPKQIDAAVVVVHGSDRVPRMIKFAKELANNNIAVLTYDKRGVGESGGVYAGPEVGTNNIDTTNLNLLAKDANAAVKVLQKQVENIPIGLIGASQAGWIMPIAANTNPTIDFLVLFSAPLISTLEQLRFQFYTNGDNDFWKTHTEADAREHTFNDPDKYQFVATDPKLSLSEISIPGLWLFGENDIQIPVKLCIEYLNEFKVKGKPFEYVLFPSLGHNTTSPSTTAPVDIALHWIKRQAILN